MLIVVLVPEHARVCVCVCERAAVDVVVRFDLAFSLIYMIGYPVAVASVLCSKLHTRYVIGLPCVIRGY